MAREVDVVIYDTVVTAMSQPGGMVWKWANQKSRRVRTVARRESPVVTGRLRDSITSFYEGSQRDSVTVGVSAGGPEAPYAKYVIKGTKPMRAGVFGKGGRSRGRIFPQNSRAFKLPPTALNPGGYVAWVSGQAPNDFLSDALREVMDTL